MNAFHIISTAPFFAKKSGAFSVEDFDLYCTILSALNWRRHNGDIALHVGVRMGVEVAGFAMGRPAGMTDAGKSGQSFSILRFLTRYESYHSE